jgi:hypothetical protein
MGEQHAEGDIAARVASVIDQNFGAEKFGDGAGDGGVEFEQSALVEKHRHGGGGDGFGEGGEIEECGDFNVRIPTQANGVLEWGTRFIFVYKISEGFQRHKSSRMRDGDGCSGEGAVGDGVTQNPESSGEDIFLSIEGGNQCWVGGQDRARLN